MLNVHKEYEPLDQDDPEASDNTSHTFSSSRRRAWKTLQYLNSRRMLLRVCFGVTVFAALISVCLYALRRPPPTLLPPYAFDDNPRPTWLDTPLKDGPLRLRVAVISGVDEFDTRQVLRESVFEGVNGQDVQMEYKFIVGRPTWFKSLWVDKKIQQEMVERGDIIMLDTVEDTRSRLSEKRFEAIKWGGSVPRGSYDWFMTLDSDTFVRFGALARRMPLLFQGRNIDPQNQSVLIGRMHRQNLYFDNHIRGPSGDSSEEDTHISGPSFEYPVGIGYMLSPFLVNTLLKMNPPPPHHINYPNDDVMIGSWISSLQIFHDFQATFETIPKSSRERPMPVSPAPLTPQPVSTVIIDDIEGWHNFVVKHPGWYDASFSWNSVCVHWVTPKDMRTFRQRPEIRKEWES